MRLYKLIAAALITLIFMGLSRLVVAQETDDPFTLNKSQALPELRGLGESRELSALRASEADSRK